SAASFLPRLPGGAGGGHAHPAGLVAGVGESAGVPGDEFGGAVMRFGFRVGIACQDGVDDGLLPFAYRLGEGFYLGDAVVVRAPDVEAGELVADRAGRGGDVGAGGTQGEHVAQVL